MKQLSKKVKISILKDIIKQIDKFSTYAQYFGLCYIIQKEYNKREIFVDVYCLDEDMKFKELSEPILRAKKRGGYSSYIKHYKSWWGGRLALIKRVLKKVEKL